MPQEKTALSQAIEKAFLYQNSLEFNSTEYMAVGVVIRHLESLLPTEREQIENAFNEGNKYQAMIKDVYPDKWKETFKDYYTNKFTDK